MVRVEGKGWAKIMNITMVTTIFPPEVGGPAIYTSEILNRFEKRGHHIKVVTSSRVAQASSNVYVLPQKRIMSFKFIGFLYSHLILLLAILRASKDSNLIYVQSPTFLGLDSLLAAKLLRKPVVLRFVGDKPWETAFSGGKTKKFLEDFLPSLEGGTYIKFLFRLQKFVLCRMKRIIVPSQFLKEVLAKYYKVDGERIRVVYNSVELPNYPNPRYKGSASVDSPVIITVGRLIRHKRIDQIIRVTKELTEAYPNIRLLIIGEGPEEENLKRLSQDLEVNNQVIFEGRLSHTEVIQSLQKADIFVLNSVYEGMPHTVIEAMAFRTPVIATNIKGTNEVVTDGETGLLVSPGSNKELKEKIIRLMKDEGLRKAIVENAYKMVEQKFTWDKNLEILEKELEGALS